MLLRRVRFSCLFGYILGAPKVSEHATHFALYTDTTLWNSMYLCLWPDGTQPSFLRFQSVVSDRRTSFSADQRCVAALPGIHGVPHNLRPCDCARLALRQPIDQVSQLSVKVS